MKKILILPMLTLFLACTGTKAPSFTVQGVDIKEEKALSTIPDELIEKRSYVLFSSEDPQYLFDDVDDMIVRGENIYIVYRKNRHFKLLKFDMNGKGVFCLDRQGEGPEEYNQISAFDVDENENMYIIDGRLDELFIYDKKGGMKKRVKLPYEVGAIRCLANGDYIFGLSSWNIDEAKGARLILTDSLLNVKNRILEYDQYNDDRAIIGSDMFTACGNVLAFNTVISNTQYMLGTDGNVLSTVVYDFGKGNIPDEDKKEVEDRVWKNDDYRAVVGHNVATDDYIFGNIWSKKETFSYIVDKKNGVLYSGENDDVNPMSVISNGTINGKIISVLLPVLASKVKDGALPDKVIEHLKNDDFAICITEMKK